MSLRTLQASSYHSEVGAGVTNPFRVNCAGEIYIVKAYDSHNRNKHLINEFICYRLAKLLELPIPDAALIHLDPSIISSEQKLVDREIQSSLLFGSKMLTQAQTVITPYFVNLAVNKDDFPSIVLFDQIIFNEDRAPNKGNLIFDYKQKMLFIIDHSHVFKDGLLWTPHSLNETNLNEEYIIRSFHAKYYKMITPWITGNSPFSKILNKLKFIGQSEISSILDEIPVEWGITTEEKHALMTFIHHRIDNVNKILGKIKDECPQWKGVIAND